MTFQLDLSGVLHVTAVHRPSGKMATVTFAESPHRLTELARLEAKGVVDELRAAATEPGAVPAPSLPDTSLASAMVARARRVLGERGPGGDPSLVRVLEAVARLEQAIAAGAASVTGLTDDLSDALLDLT